MFNKLKQFDLATTLGTAAGHATRTTKASVPTAKRHVRNFYDRTAEAYRNTQN